MPGKRKRCAPAPAPVPAKLTEKSSVSCNSKLRPQRWVLVTGQPNSGKTFLVKKITEALLKHSVSISGFYTDEVLHAGKRIGFDVVTIPGGRRGVLARKSKQGKYAKFPRVGAYSVDVDSFENLALPALEPADPSTILVVDEIGRMELKSTRFKDTIDRILNDPQRRVFGAITAPIYGHRVPFCDSITERTNDVETHRIKKSNRDQVREMLLRKVVQAWGV